MKANNKEDSTKPSDFCMDEIFRDPLNFTMGIDSYEEEDSQSGVCLLFIKGGVEYSFTQNKNESFKEFSRRVDKELRTL